MPDKRQSGGLLLIFGYVGVVAGTVAFIVSYWYERFPEETVAYVALGLGIGLAGLACWRWTISCRSLGVDPVVTRGPTHWMAAAAFVLAAFPAALTCQVYDLHRQFSHQATLEYPHYRLIISGGSAFAAGLLLASLGLWVLGNAPGMQSGESVSSIAQEQSPGSGLTDTETNRVSGTGRIVIP
jgi:hypothetical protein